MLKLKKFGSYKNIQDPAVLKTLDDDFSQVHAIDKLAIVDANMTVSKLGYTIANIESIRKKLQQLNEQMWAVRRNTIGFPDDDDLIWDHVTDDQEEWADALRERINSVMYSFNVTLRFWGKIVTIVKK